MPTLTCHINIQIYKNCNVPTSLLYNILNVFSQISMLISASKQPERKSSHITGGHFKGELSANYYTMSSNPYYDNRFCPSPLIPIHQ